MHAHTDGMCCPRIARQPPPGIRVSDQIAGANSIFIRAVLALEDGDSANQRNPGSTGGGTFRLNRDGRRAVWRMQDILTVS
jgi:hypothetical protein